VGAQATAAPPWSWLCADADGLVRAARVLLTHSAECYETRTKVSAARAARVGGSTATRGARLFECEVVGTMKHLARGIPLAAVIRSVVGPGHVVRIDEDFSVGPVPQPDEPLELWSARRALYWNVQPDWVGFDEDAAFSGGPMTLWLGQSPADRLPACWWCAEALRRGVVDEVAVVDIAAPSLGALRDEWVATLTTGQPIDRAYVEVLADLWRAWCAPDPAALVALSHGEPDDPQAHAARRLLDRYLHCAGSYDG